ncbi:MAG TPA: hypothetical protein VEU30_03630, partial [Thermoanaerobaculia bacterium]|nr:hypothetical protein [Thermoanaerobaculia bacterium]
VGFVVIQSARADYRPNASNVTRRKPGRDYVEYSATIELDPLAPGSYEISASLQGLHATTEFLLSNGTETPELRFEYLARMAARATSYDEYKRIQLERAALQPDRAAPLRELAHRALRDGTLEEANRFFDLTVEALQRNLDRIKRTYPQKASTYEVSNARAVAEVRGLQALLPDYFARHGNVWLESIASDGKTRWVLTDRQGRVLRESQ